MSDDASIASPAARRGRWVLSGMALILLVTLLPAQDHCLRGWSNGSRIALRLLTLSAWFPIAFALGRIRPRVSLLGRMDPVDMYAQWQILGRSGKRTVLTNLAVVLFQILVASIEMACIRPRALACGIAIATSTVILLLQMCFILRADAAKLQKELFDHLSG